MIIGVFSDIHDNLFFLERALMEFKHHDISTLIFCGDFCSPIAVKSMGENFQGKIHCVYGNGDGDRFAITKLANAEFKNIKVYGEYAELEFDGKNLAVTHYPLYGKALARTGDYHAVFYGHTHVKEYEFYGECLCVNPGEVMGWKKAPSIFIYNTQDNDGKFYALDLTRN